MMAKFLITNRIESPGDIKAFNESGYQFCEQESTDISPVFKRSEKKEISSLNFSGIPAFILSSKYFVRTAYSGVFP